MKVIACVEDAAVIQKIPDYLKRKAVTRERFPFSERRVPPTGEQAIVLFD